MIKPATLWGLFKTCQDPVWIGKICQALGGQTVEIDFGQRQMVNAIKLDSGWMDERIEAQRERWRDRKRAYRSGQCETSETSPTLSSVSQCPPMSHDVTIHPSVRPSVRPDISNDMSCESMVEPRTRESDGRPIHVPTDDEAKIAARSIGVPEDYLPQFFDLMKSKGWGYVNASGSHVNLNRRNFKSVLSSFWSQEKKSREKLPTGMIHKQENYYASKLGI